MSPDLPTIITVTGFQGRKAAEASTLSSAGAQQKLEEDGHQLNGCTFAPKTGRPPKQDAAPKQAFSERLYRRRDTKFAQVLSDDTQCTCLTTNVQHLHDSGVVCVTDAVMPKCPLSLHPIWGCNNPAVTWGSMQPKHLHGECFVIARRRNQT